MSRKPMMTIKEMADMVGVDKQKIYRFIKKNRIKNCINEALQKSNVKHYDEAVQRLVIHEFSDKKPHHEALHESHQNHINEAVFDALLKQFEALQKELDHKNQQIENLHSLLNHEQQLRMVVEQKLLPNISSVEEEKTENNSPISSDTEEQTQKKWWQFWK